MERKRNISKSQNKQKPKSYLLFHILRTLDHFFHIDSKNLKSGDLVIALGHAGGYDPVRTPPVRFGRVISSDASGFLNTDCTLIGGDSGGPLFDLEGNVIGIHSSIGHSLSVNNHTGIDGFKKGWDRMKKGESWGRLGGTACTGRCRGFAVDV